MDHDRDLRRHLLELLRGGHAHIGFDQAVRDFPAALRGTAPAGSPHTPWQLLEHLRIAQRDILDFSRNESGTYSELKWPDEYWPPEAAPPNTRAWDDSIRRFREDATVFEEMLQDTSRDLLHPFRWGDGQTLLREALLLADHNAYHIGQLMLVRRMLEGEPKG